MSSHEPLTFYFDYLSPYAYFAWFMVERLRREHDLELRLQPVLFPALLNHWGQLGPAEIPPKRLFVFKDIVRHAHREGLPLKGPARHPFNPLLPLRLSLREVAGEHQEKVVAALWRMGWADGGDYANADALKDALDKAGLPTEELFEKAQSPEAKEALRQHTDEAIALGVFGVPTMIVRGELFWGKDQYESMDRFLTGEDPPEVSAVAEMMGRVSDVKRKK